MTEKPVPNEALASTAKPMGNPAFNMMGLPRISRWKLPSRNWLIFLGITGSWTTALLYDRYQKKIAQRKWCSLVEHLAQEALPVNTLPRKITIHLAAPPGDGLRVARDHFHEYIKPILVAGAMDWDVIEGRREGEVRVGLAEKIRKMRIRNGEEPIVRTDEDNEQDAVRIVRQQFGLKEWEGVHGDLVLGRHTWKEYVRGLHEGWLGPLDAPQASESSQLDTSLSSSANEVTDSATPSESPSTNPALSTHETPSSESQSVPAPEPSTKELPKPKKPTPTPTPPFISPTEYLTSSQATTIPAQLPPTVTLPLPHLLGFLNTPTRIYRFLTRRRLADETGASVAALVLAARSRPYRLSAEFATSVAADPASPSSAVEEADIVQIGQAWEQEAVLKGEEEEWHKSAWKPNEEGIKVERVWQEKMVIDERIGGRMKVFELDDGADARAYALMEEKDKHREGVLTKVQKLLGVGGKEKGGWNMGLEGDQSD